MGNNQRNLRGRAGIGAEAGTKKGTTIGAGDIILAKETLGDDDILDLGQGIVGIVLVTDQENTEGLPQKAGKTRENMEYLKVAITGNIETEAQTSFQIIAGEDKATEMARDRGHRSERNLQNTSVGGAIVQEKNELPLLPGIVFSTSCCYKYVQPKRFMIF